MKLVSNNTRGGKSLPLAGLLAGILLGGMLLATRTALADTDDTAGTALHPQSNCSSESPPGQQVQLAAGQIELTLPTNWKQVTPRHAAIEAEYQIGAVAAADLAAKQPLPSIRLTMTLAEGEVATHFQQWVGQFRLGQDADGKDTMVRQQLQLDGTTIHLLDIAGTYYDAPQGASGPRVELPDHRMLAAIIPVEGIGDLLLEFCGPEPLVTSQGAAFRAMLKSLQLQPIDSTASQPVDSPPVEEHPVKPVAEGPHATEPPAEQPLPEAKRVAHDVAVVIQAKRVSRTFNVWRVRRRLPRLMDLNW